MFVRDGLVKNPNCRQASIKVAAVSKYRSVINDSKTA